MPFGISLSNVTQKTLSLRAQISVRVPPCETFVIVSGVCRSICIRLPGFSVLNVITFDPLIDVVFGHELHRQVVMLHVPPFTLRRYRSAQHFLQRDRLQSVLRRIRKRGIATTNKP